VVVNLDDRNVEKMSNNELGRDSLRIPEQTLILTTETALMARIMTTK
jgi:hypothetical protein